MRKEQNVIYSGFRGDWPAVQFKVPITPAVATKAVENAPVRKEEEDVRDRQSAIWKDKGL